MASKEDAATEDNCNTETEEETLALLKKRSRRVSFAETTAIHIFDRDDEYDTPPDPKSGSDGGESPANEEQGLRRTESDEINGLLQSDDEDNGGDADDDAEVVRTSFLRPIESPSPGSYFGSATSNDDDNYFGPVSADFIKPGHLSDSAASDVDHDITMDSTAFSMHFRSLARSDSGAECKTPTGVYLTYGDGTPSLTSLAENAGNSMVLTGDKKPHLQSCLPDGKGNAADSNDMSLVGGNPHKYDYGKISPGLDALLSPDHTNIQAGSLSCNAEGLSFGTYSGVEDKSSTFLQNKSGIQNLVDLGVSSSSDIQEMPSESVSATAMNIDKEDSNIETIAPQASSDSSNKVLLITKVPTDGQLSTPNQQSKDILIGKRRISEKGASESGSISSLSAKRRQIFIDANNSSHHKWDSTPSWITPGSFYSWGSAQTARSLVSFEKSSSRLKWPEHFPFASTSKAINNSRLKLEHCISKSPIRKFVEENRIDNKINDVAATVVCLEDQFSRVIVNDQQQKSDRDINDQQQKSDRDINDQQQKSNQDLNEQQLKSKQDINDQQQKRKQDINDRSTFENVRSVRHCGDENVARHGTLSYSPTWLCSQDKPAEQFNATASPSQAKLSRENVLENILSTTNHTEGLLHSVESVLSSQEIPLDDNNYRSAADAYEAKAFLTEQGSISRGSESEKHQENLSTNLNRQGNMEGKQDGYAIENTSLNTNIERRDSHFHEKTSEFRVSSIDIESSDGFAQFSKSSDQDIMLNTPRSISRISMNTPLGDGNSKTCAYGSSNHSVGASKKLIAAMEVLTRISGVSKELLPPSINMLNLQAIENLEDILVRLQKVKTYEGLLQNICSQRVADQMGYARNRRVADMKLLLHRTVYEKAKLHLMHAKRDKLLNQVQSLNSGLQDSEVLKSRCHQSSCVSIRRDSPVSLESSEVDLSAKDVIPDEKIAKLRQSLENSGIKIKNLTQSFHSYLKMKEEPDCFGTIVFVQDHLKKKAPCQLLHRELQPLEVESLETKSGQHDVLLNYSRFIFQRLKVNTKCRPSVAISNKLNESKISKAFRKMDACAAFRFIWSNTTTLKYVGPTTMAEQIQRTSSTLCNMLDVLEEIALAQLELRNLIRATFCVRSDEKLDLQLCFVDFKSGKTVNLSLDFSCLKCGIYPSEVMPYDVNGASGETMTTFRSLLADIRAALGPHEGGYMRVIRLCRIVSNLLQGSWSVG